MQKYRRFIPVMFLGAILLLSFNTPDGAGKNIPSSSDEFAIPANVQKVIDHSCFGCHNMEAKNEKSKSKLMFETLDTMKVAKLVGKLTDIRDEVKDDKMPPRKFLEFKPEAALTAAQKELLINWADSTARSYIQ